MAGGAADAREELSTPAHESDKQSRERAVSFLIISRIGGIPPREKGNQNGVSRTITPLLGLAAFGAGAGSGGNEAAEGSRGAAAGVDGALGAGAAAAWIGVLLRFAALAEAALVDAVVSDVGASCVLGAAVAAGGAVGSGIGVGAAAVVAIGAVAVAAGAVEVSTGAALGVVEGEVAVEASELPPSNLMPPITSTTTATPITANTIAPPFFFFGYRSSSSSSVLATGTM